MAWRARRLWSRLPPRSRFYARTTQYRSERAAIGRRGALLVGALAVLVGYAVIYGYESGGSGASNELDLGASLHAFVIAITRPAVALPVALGLLVLVAWLFRRVRLAWLVWWGGPVLVSDFRAGSKLVSLEPAQLTAQFRERLAVLRLQAATPSPGAAPEGTFVDVLSDGETQSSTVLGLLLRLLRAAVPTYAIEVQGVVREHDEREQYGVMVQVVQTPGQPSSVIEVRDTSWERAICRAADEATAAILPRSRLCRGTWAAWRGYVMPEGLLSAYEKAAKLEQDRRFDEALDQYWEALRLDPTNLSVRLRLGQLQEKAGLLLAALTNYQRILAFGNPGAKNLPRGMYRRGARREWDRALSVAKYRAIVLLGGRTILRQWSRPSDEQEEDHHRRKRLHEEFKPLLTSLATTPRRDPAAEMISRATGILINVGPRMRHKRERETRLKLMDCADSAAHELKLSLPRRESRAWRQLLTRRTVALAQVSIARRHMLLDADSGASSFGESDLRALDLRIRRAGWRPGPLTGWWPTWLRRWQWHEHYNAACVYAAYLRPHDSGRHAVAAPTRAELVQRAVERLERAITTRDSEFVVTWRDWVVSEDRALDLLRTEPEFRSFEAMYFPSHVPARAIRRRPADPHRLAEIRYTRDLLIALAQSCHHTWHARAKDGARADVHALPGWCEQEREIWVLVRNVVDDCYDWRLRRDLLKRVNALMSETRAVCVQFSRYEDRPPARDGGMREEEVYRDTREASNKRTRAEARLGELALLLKTGDTQGAAYFERWSNAMRVYDAHQAAAADGRVELCAHNAVVWDTLSRWLRAGEDDGLAHDKRESLVRVAYGELVVKLDDAARSWERRASSASGACHRGLLSRFQS